MSKKLNRLINWIFHGIPQYNVKAEIKTVNPYQRLKDKVILITGGSRGLGFDMAKRFLKEDAKVVICGKNHENLKKASEILNNCKYLQFDLQDINQFKDIFNKAEELVGDKINCLINNAGISLHEYSFLEVTEENFDNQFDTNIKAPYFLTQEFIKYNNNNTDILFISSERGLNSDTIPYGLTKSCLNNFAQGLAKKYINNNIRVNILAPGVTASDMTGINKDDNLYREDNIGKRALLPEEIAETACFILSNESKCINGAIIPCNLGNHIK